MLFRRKGRTLNGAAALFLTVTDYFLIMKVCSLRMTQFVNIKRTSLSRGKKKRSYSFSAVVTTEASSIYKR